MPSPGTVTVLFPGLETSIDRSQTGQVTVTFGALSAPVDLTPSSPTGAIRVLLGYSGDDEP